CGELTYFLTNLIVFPLFMSRMKYIEFFQELTSRVTCSLISICLITFPNKSLITRVYRPHRSHLIHLNYVKKYLKGEGTIVMEGNQLVSISRDKKGEFEERLRKLGIMK